MTYLKNLSVFWLPVPGLLPKKLARTLLHPNPADFPGLLFSLLRVYVSQQSLKCVPPRSSLRSVLFRGLGLRLTPFEFTAWPLPRGPLSDSCTTASPSIVMTPTNTNDIRPTPKCRTMRAVKVSQTRMPMMNTRVVTISGKTRTALLTVSFCVKAPELNLTRTHPKPS